MPNASLKPILHIGPPKTATTSLQESVIPHLGRPYLIKPAWGQRMARDASYDPPANLAPNVIISDERLGGFGMFTPATIADRLAQIFSDARVVVVTRDAVDLFYSLYRQMLLNRVSLQSAAVLKLGTWLLPESADVLFDHWRQTYSQNGTGFFAITNLSSLRIAFERYFDFATIKFELLRAAPAVFSSAFAQECGSHALPVLSHANETRLNLMEEELQACPPEFPEFLRARFVEFYQSSRLTADREQFLRDHQFRLSLHAFASSFRFRKD